MKKVLIRTKLVKLKMRHYSKAVFTTRLITD